MGKRRSRGDAAGSSSSAAHVARNASPALIHASSRKARRKEERSHKKRKIASSSVGSSGNEDGACTPVHVELEDDTKVRGKKEAMIAPNKERRRSKKHRSHADTYDGLKPDLAAELRRDDEEIRTLEMKLGLASSTGKGRLNKEYGLEGYGDDFGDFLDGLDALVNRVSGSARPSGDDHGYADSLSEGSVSDGTEESEEIVPMKGPAHDLDEDDSVMGSEGLESSIGHHPAGEPSDSSDEGSSHNDSDVEEREPDHDNAYTYGPTKGEDIYGKCVEPSGSSAESKRYVPPHQRDKASNETAMEIQHSLNRALNRLSEDTLLPTSQCVAKLYSVFPTSDVHECLWKNLCRACVESPMVMTGLIPVYVATLCGVHILKGDGAQLGEHLTEKAVLSLWNKLESERNNEGASSPDDGSTKEAGNLALVLCYLYNYGVVHCSLIYEVVRHLIEKFHEIDVETLLLVLSHSGRALRSDDPTALKEIVLSVQKRASDASADRTASFSSRVEYMVSAITDLKNNKKRKQDVSYGERTSKIRKVLGQIKSGVAISAGSGRSSNASLRISLSDILSAESKGRWWKVGASWVGNQFSYQENHEAPVDDSSTKSKKVDASWPNVSPEADERLLKLAMKYRMNTDIRRAIFCIIMGSADCDDAFEKLARGGMLKSRCEKEVVRVLMECAGNEKSYNKFYAHLSARICEFQPQCKFSFQLAFWDTFKQFEGMKVRKAANLAKLLHHLVVVERILKLNVLKTIDMSSPSELSEPAVVFLTIFFTHLLHQLDDPTSVSSFFETALTSRNQQLDQAQTKVDELEQMDESEALRANMMVFFMQVLKHSPEYTKGSKFRSCVKAAIKACDVDNFF